MNRDRPHERTLVDYSVCGSGDSPRPVADPSNVDTPQQEATRFFEMCWVDQAHTDARQLLEALIAIAKEDAAKESFLSYVEAALETRTSREVAAKLHTAPTIHLVTLRGAFLGVMRKIIGLQQALLQRSKEYANSAIPYYTHLQQAQPGTLGHYLLSKLAVLDDDFGRCKDAYVRMNRNPLGGVGRSGTGWPIDRSITTRLLGFDDIIDNSLLCRDTNYAAEMASILAIMMSHVNDIASDLQLWFTREFNYITLPDGFCSFSSIFPQKKNPVTLDGIRQLTGPAVNWGSSALATYRCLGTGDQIVHSMPLELAGAISTTNGVLSHMSEVVMAFGFNEEHASQVLKDGWSTLSNLTDWLAQKTGIPFRVGHDIVIGLFADCTASRLRCAEITAAMVMAKVKALTGQEIWLTQEDVDSALDPAEFIRTRVSTGGIGPMEVQRMIADAGASIVRNSSWVTEKEEQIDFAQQLLAVEIFSITHMGICARSHL
ncbi:argininosuccinate lyase [Pterulicium gracile]|uniref:Arginosuccinase n=1 Tax=Pterulicium gracile TaxID=1884261 RepID=A0A5C3Q763_9AGAR|nr:argininosuccinate lyase [Pterula gracilis]